MTNILKRLFEIVSITDEQLDNYRKRVRESVLIIGDSDNESDNESDNDFFDNIINLPNYQERHRYPKKFKRKLQRHNAFRNIYLKL